MTARWRCWVVDPRRAMGVASLAGLASLASLVALGCVGSSEDGDAASDSDAASDTTSSGDVTSSGGEATTRPATSDTTGTTGESPDSSGESTITTSGGDPDTDDDTGVAATEGWIELPNTLMNDVCPPDAACGAAISSWSGGIGDTARDRLIVWGGGHQDYYGNELYSLDVDLEQLVRLNDPSPYNPNPDECINTLSDGAPNSRHTYDGLTYIEHADRLFAFGGALACGGGYFGNDTWTLDLETLEWTAMDPHDGGTPEPVPGIVSDYDPVTGAVFLHDNQRLWRYDYDDNRYTELAGDQAIDYHLTGRIDPVRREFVLVGCRDCGESARGLLRISIADGSDYALEDLTDVAVGCDELIAEPSPGLAWEPGSERLVGWPGGEDVFAVDLGAMECTRYTATGGPGAQQGNGTFGRWRFFPDEGVFIVVNDAGQNAWAFRLGG